MAFIVITKSDVYVAAQKDNTAIIRLLIRSDPAKLSSAPLELAIKKGDLVVVNALLKSGACKVGATCIAFAAEIGDVVILQSILKAAVAEEEEQNIIGTGTVEENDYDRDISSRQPHHLRSSSASLVLARAIQDGDEAIIRCLLLAGLPVHVGLLN